MEVPIIKEIVIIFALSIAVLLFCHRLRLPSVVGFLFTGVLCGPHGLGLVNSIDDVQSLATIGVVLLLFTVGMEVSVQNIVRYRYFFFVGGVLQVFLTLGACLLVGVYGLDRTWGIALYLGFLVTLSSTAIVLRVLDDKNESESPHGRLILGVLIFQDILAVPMLLLVPVLAGTGEEFDGHHLYTLAKGTGLLVTMAFVAYKLVPKLLYYVTRTRNKELFLLSVLTICFAVAWVTSSIGLSLSLGAFLAGLVVSESEYSDEAVGNIFPFQAIFTSFFFVSMGMLLDMGFVVQQPFLIFGIAALVIVAKFLLSGGTALALGMPLRSAVLAGVGLAQIGEFSFVIAQAGMSHGITTEYQYQLFLAVSLLTMAVTPSLMSLANQLAIYLGRLPIPLKIKTGFNYSHDVTGHMKLENHIIIAGFGLRGRHLARVAKESNIPYVILEMNPETVKKEKKNGEPIRYGDPSHHSVLQHAGIREARIVAVVINDPVATMRIVKMARELNPNVYIITRTRYFQEAQSLFRIGANDVIPDEFGSSLEVFARVLQKCDIPRDLISKCVNDMRIEGYEALHLNSSDYSAPAQLPFESTDARIETFNIMPGTQLAGKTLAESELRKMHGLTVLLIKRQNQTMTTLEADTQLHEGDNLVVIGTPENIVHAKNLFQLIT